MRTSTIRTIFLALFGITALAVLVIPFIVFTKEERRLLRFEMGEWYRKNVTPFFAFFGDRWRTLKAKFAPETELAKEDFDPLREVSATVI